MGAAAVFETAAETPPTVIKSQFLTLWTLSPNSHQSIHVSDSDGGGGAMAEVDILKKSIAKGGLLRDKLA